MPQKSSHWYTREGKPCHTQPVKSRPGETRPTTLADARKQRLLPSVTNVKDILDKPQVNDWNMKQVSKEWHSRLSLIGKAGRAEGDIAHAIADLLARDFDELHEDIVDHGLREVKQAADAGSLIHKGAELALQGLEYDHDIPVFLPELKATFPLSCFIKPIEAFVKENEIKPLGHEVPIVNLTHGYGGTGDLPMTCPKGTGFGDFKTRKTTPGKPVIPYDTQVMQIAAYHFAYPDVWQNPKGTGFNLYISSTEPGRVEATWYNSDALLNAYRAFTDLCAVWRFLKGYHPHL